MTEPRKATFLSNVSRDAAASLAISLVTCGTVLAAEWHPVADHDGQIMYVDGTRIHGSVPAGKPLVACQRGQPAGGCVVRTQAKLVYAAHSHRGTGPDEVRWLDHELSELAIDCAADTYRVESTSVYYDDGTHDTTDATPIPGPWTPVVAGSLLDGVREFSCGPINMAAELAASKAAGWSLGQWATWSACSPEVRF